MFPRALVFIGVRQSLKHMSPVVSPTNLRPFSVGIVQSPKMSSEHTVYQFSVKDADGKEVSLEKYRGHPLIIVNVASECGLTSKNYTQLKEIMDKYKEQGLCIAAFPCNQFAGQEPKCEIDIRNFQKDRFKFEPDLYAKIDVNGENADPLYKFLKKEKGGTLFDAIKWNFTKFLVDKNGHVVKRYSPTTAPNDMIKDIEAVIADGK